MIKLLIAYSLAQCLTDRAFVAFGLLKALLLAGFTWWLCGFSMWLWNRHFRMRIIHHGFCAFAAAVTLISIFVFQCLGEVKRHALTDLKNWQEAYNSDGSYAWETFLQAHDRLQQIYRENGWHWDAKKYLEPPRTPPTDSTRYVLPADREEEREASLKVYCDRCIDNLNASQPTLSRILWNGAKIDMDPLREDLSDFQQNHPNGIYDLSTGSLRIAGELCFARLNQAVAKQVLHLRWALIVLFLLAQFIAFGLAGHSAYSDLKINR